MSRKNLASLLILSLLLVIYALSRAYISAKRNAERALFGMDVKTINKINLFNGESDIIIEKNGSAYSFSAPYKGIDADAVSVNQYLKLLSKIEIVKNLGRVEDSVLVGYGITPRSARITLASGQHQETLVLGAKNPVAPQCYVYKKNSGVLCLTGKNAEVMFHSLPDNFRARRVLNIDPEIITYIGITAKDSYDYRKDGKEWYVTEKNSGRQYLCDKNKVKDLLSTITSLSVSDFKPKDENYSHSFCGLGRPAVSMNITTSSSALKTIEFGNYYGRGKIYFAVDNNVAGGADASFLDAVLRPSSYFFLDKIVDFNLASAVRFTSSDGEVNAVYEKKRGIWYKTIRRKIEFDAGKVQQFFAVLDGLKIEKYYFDVPLGTVKKEYVFYNRKGEMLLGLTIGETFEGRTKIAFKDKKGVYGIATPPEELLAL